jgi:hypothetical protein
MQGKMQIATLQETHEDARAALDRETKLAVAELGAKIDRLSLFLDERARVGSQQQDTQQASLDRAHEAAMAHADAGHDQDLAAQEQAAQQQQNQHDASMQVMQSQPPQPQANPNA